jgi:hypothetical protein
MKKTVIYISLGIILVVVFYTFSGQSQVDYKNQITEWRKEQEDFLKNDPESPFVKYDREFNGLSYYDPDEKFRIRASLNKNTDQKIITVRTSDNQERQYKVYGTLQFTLDSRKYTLSALKPVSMPSYPGLFVPFSDETSAITTYGGGRYLDVEFEEGDKFVTLDFNKAYNPYCNYVEKYSCPIPPPENHLGIEITAGEKTYDY